MTPILGDSCGRHTRYAESCGLARTPRKTRRHLLQRLFPGFPAGYSGIALLLLRSVIALSVLVQGGFYLREAGGAPEMLLAGLAALAAGVLLLIGYLTPIAGAAVGLGAIGVEFSLLP